MTILHSSGNGGTVTSSGPVTSLRVVRGTTQAIPSTVATTIIYNETDYDVLGEWNGTLGIFTATVEGVYNISASVSSEESWTAGEKCILELHVNGALNDYLSTTYAEVTGVMNAHVQGSVNVSLSAGDTVEIQMYHDRGVALNTLANGPSMSNGQYNYIDIALVQGLTVIGSPNPYDLQVAVKTPNELSGTLSSSVEYFLDGVIDFTGTGINIEVPSGGLTLRGHSFNISKLICSDDNYTLFTSPVGGSGDIIGAEFAIEITGTTNSRVYDITALDTFRAIEMSRVNYNDCTSLGVITEYMQGFETGTGRFGGQPTLTLAGVWGGGYFLEGSVVRRLDPAMTSPVFEAGAGFVMNSRFKTNQNVDLPASASYLDFASSNFPNPSTLQLEGMLLTRNGAQNPSDANITPNIEASELPCHWEGNVGVNNTHVGGRSTITTEVATVITVQGDYYDILGSTTTSLLEHFDSPSPSQLRHLGSSPHDYKIYFDAVLEGTANNDLALKIVKWNDNTSSFEDVGIQRRPVSSLLGSRDVAFFDGQFAVRLEVNDYVKWQVANLSSTSNVTAELESFMILTER